jgi:hypothetical protein
VWLALLVKLFVLLTLPIDVQTVENAHELFEAHRKYKQVSHAQLLHHHCRICDAWY